LSDWLETPPGQYLLVREQAFFDRAVADIFGFNALQLGLPRQAFLRASRIPLRAVAGDEPGVQLRLLPQELPLETGSLDLLLLPHVLEFNDDPHQILREAERVLRAEGELIVSGFNPLSRGRGGAGMPRRPALEW
jgi:SAM-dependent methyltransferase